jgi:NitT/TauT family transport system substrate-binding protein
MSVDRIMMSPPCFQIGPVSIVVRLAGGADCWEHHSARLRKCRLKRSMNSPPLSQRPGIFFRRRLWHRLRMLRVLGFALAAMIALAAQTSATVADRIRVAVQRTGTLAWELDVIRTHGLDRKLDLAIETVELASTEAGKIALKGGSADLMLSDWLWVARERSLGDDLVFYPSSSTLGAVMVPARSPIREIIDLRGRKLAVAGGPLDKSWLLLQALARRGGLDLKKQATVVYGAPPLLSEKALQGETDATLTFWNFCADLESKGYTRAIAMDHVVKALGAKGPVALVGYTFDRAWAARNGSTLERFLAAARQAKDILASSQAEWQRLAPRMRVTDLDALAIYRQRYGDGIVRRSLAEEEADARALYLVLAEIGGAELVGPARELAAGTFYRPAARE